VIYSEHQATLFEFALAHFDLATRLGQVIPLDCFVPPPTRRRNCPRRASGANRGACCASATGPLRTCSTSYRFTNPETGNLAGAGERDASIGNPRPVPAHRPPFSASFCSAGRPSPSQRRHRRIPSFISRSKARRTEVRAPPARSSSATFPLALHQILATISCFNCNKRRSFKFRTIGRQSFPMAIREWREFAAMPLFDKLQMAFCGPIIAPAGFPKFRLT